MDKSPWYMRARVPVLVALGIMVAVAVAAVTGKASWGHIVHVGRMVGEPDAGLLPVAVDGMMITGAIMGAIDTLRKRKPRTWSIIALWLGAALTLTFNAASAWERGIAAILIAAMYALTFLVTVETLFHPSKRWIQSVLDERAAELAAQTAAATALTQAESEPAPAPMATTPVAPIEPVEAPQAPEPATPEPAVKPARKPRKQATPGAPRGANTRPRAREVAADEQTAPEPDGPTVRPRPLAITATAVRVVDPPLAPAFSASTSE